MHRVYIVALLFLVIGTACRQVPIGNIPSGTSTPIVITSDATETPSPIPTSTNTFIPTQTPTATITPLPTIPTFTPTFDASTIVTVTPAPQAECPKEDSAIKINFLIPRILDDRSITSPNLINDVKVLDYLNMGGSLSTLLSNLQKSALLDRYKYQDFTGDGEKDLLIEHFAGLGYRDIRIYICVHGVYQSFSAIDEDWAPLESSAQILAIRDLDKNGIPDIVISDKPILLILEWQVSTFSRFMLRGPSSMKDRGEIKDINNDGLDEIILAGKEIKIYRLAFDENIYKGAPWRDESIVYSWDGHNYVQQPGDYSPAEYRFQEVQDGDQFMLQGKYELALDAYQNAIFDSKLKWWSPEMRAYEIEILDARINNLATPMYPPENITEYPKLSSYSYYRIMLLHIVQGNESDASTVYKTLQQKFSNDPYGQPYVAMATSFWDAYQSTHKMYDSCAAAIQYAAEHPEILTPLGSDYHGMQSHIYVPADVCPFR